MDNAASQNASTEVGCTPLPYYTVSESESHQLTEGLVNGMLNIYRAPYMIVNNFFKCV